MALKFEGVVHVDGTEASSNVVIIEATTGTSYIHIQDHGPQFHRPGIRVGGEELVFEIYREWKEELVSISTMRVLGKCRVSVLDHASDKYVKESEPNCVPVVLYCIYSFFCSHPSFKELLDLF